MVATSSILTSVLFGFLRCLAFLPQQQFDEQLQLSSISNDDLAFALMGGMGDAIVHLLFISIYTEKVYYFPMFDEEVYKRLKGLEAQNGCIEFVGTYSKNGYGKIPFNKKLFSAHRVSFALHKGPIPPKKMICHTCRNKKCINPNHLYAGTAYENNRDSFIKKRTSNITHVGCAVPVELHNMVFDKCNKLQISLKEYITNLIKTDLNL